MAKMKKFCPNCGRETERLVEGLCKECFYKRKKPAGIPDRIDVEMCSCGKIRYKGKWTKAGIKKIIRDKFKGNEKEMELKKTNNHFKADIKIKNFFGENKDLQKEIYIKINKSTCNDCGRIRGGYYEAVIQLRGPKKRVDKSVKYIFEKVEKSKEKRSFVSDIKKVSAKKSEKKGKISGIDVYLGSKSLARRISKEIGKKFNTKHKESYTLVGMKNGKKVYRNKMLLRL